MKKLLLCVFMSVFLMAGVASAQERKDSYIGLEGGLFMPSESGLDSGLDFGVKYVSYFTKNFGFNVLFGYKSFSGKMDVVNWWTGDIYQFDMDVTTMSLGLGLSGRLPLMESLDLVADAGITFNMDSIKLGDASNDDSNIGFYLDAGVNYLVTPSIAVGGLIRYSINEYSDIGLGGLSVLLTAGYMF